MSQINEQEDISPQDESERWSRDSIQQRRLENLKKARESLKKKRENELQSMSQPFTVTPVTQVSIPTTPRADVEVIEQARGSTFSNRIWDTTLGVASSVIGVMFAAAVPLLVSSVINLYTESFSTPSSSNNDGKKVSPSNHLYHGQSIFVER